MTDLPRGSAVEYAVALVYCVTAGVVRFDLHAASAAEADRPEVVSTPLSASAIVASAASFLPGGERLVLSGSVEGAGWPDYDIRIALFTAATIAAVLYDVGKLVRAPAVAVPGVAP